MDSNAQIVTCTCVCNGSRSFQSWQHASSSCQENTLADQQKSALKVYVAGHFHAQYAIREYDQYMSSNLSVGMLYLSRNIQGLPLISVPRSAVAMTGFCWLLSAQYLQHLSTHWSSMMCTVATDQSLLGHAQCESGPLQQSATKYTSPCRLCRHISVRWCIPSVCTVLSETG